MKATNKWVQAQVAKVQTGFLVSDSSLLEGEVISVGQEVEHIKKGQTVLFPSIHGKVMEHSIKGTKYYFIDKDVILAAE